jgi:hypothetical protein
MRHYIEQSNGLVLSLLCKFWVDCIIATRGYDFRKGQGFIGMLAGIGATLSPTFFGLVVGNFGSAIGFLSIAAAALAAVFLAWLLMPETKPANEKSEPLRSA